MKILEYIESVGTSEGASKGWENRARRAQSAPEKMQHLYSLHKANSPLSFRDLKPDKGLDDASSRASLNSLVKNGHVSKGGDKYMITSQGRAALKEYWTNRQDTD